MGAFSSDFKETKGIIAGRSGKMSQMPRGSALLLKTKTKQ